MHNAFVRFVCRMLVASMIVLPFQAQAELIATGQAAAAAQAPAARALLATQLERLGIEADSARERVAALTDAEALSLAARVNDAPAGAGLPGLTVGIILVAIFLIWRFQFSDQAVAERQQKK